MTKTIDQPQIEVLFREFVAAFQAQDVERVGACLTDDFEWRLPNGEVYSGKRDALAAMAKRFAATDGPRFSDSQFRFFGDTVLQTYRVEVGSENDTQHTQGMDAYTVRDGLIALKDAYWKQLR